MKRIRGAALAATMLTAPAEYLKGSPVRVAIRPERACLDDEAGPNRVAADVTFVRDLGPVREYHLKTALGPVIVEYALGEGDLGLKKGDTCEVRLPPDALHVFPSDMPAMAAE